MNYLHFFLEDYFFNGSMGGASHTGSGIFDLAGMGQAIVNQFFELVLEDGLVKVRKRQLDDIRQKHRDEIPEFVWEHLGFLEKQPGQIRPEPRARLTNAEYIIWKEKRRRILELLGALPMPTSEPSLPTTATTDLFSGERNIVFPNAPYTIKSILEASYPTSPEAYVKGYIFSIDFKASQSNNTILLQKSGNCSSKSYSESDDFFPYSGGQIFTNLRLCY